MTIMTALTGSAEPTTEAPSEFCDCYRDGDRWACQSRDNSGPRSCHPTTGLTCALVATVNSTGRDDWDRVNVKELRPCSCGRPRNTRA
jgi:hypothetical protein